MLGTLAVLDYWKRRYTPLVALIGVAVTAALALALSGQSERARYILAGLTAFAPVAAGLLIMSGIVSEDRESNLILIWFQKPARLVRTYALRYAVSQGVLLLLSTVLGIAMTGVSLAGELYPFARALRWLFPIWAFTSVTGAIVFALSAWGARRDSTIALLIIIGSLTIAAKTAFDDSPRAHFIRAFAFPLESASVLSGSTTSPSLRYALVVVLAHCVGWTLLGFLGLRFTERALARGR
jgi:hypothetical protein